MVSVMDSGLEICPISSVALGYLVPHSSDSSHSLALRKVAVAVEQMLFFLCKTLSPMQSPDWC